MATVEAETAAVADAAPLPLPENHFFLNGVSWAEYLLIGKGFRDRAGVRINYAGGRLELMTTSNPHEQWKKWAARLLETLTEEARIRIASSGNVTLSREDLDRGFEPDECYYVQNEARMRGLRDLDLTRDPPPDLAIEVEVSRTILDRIALYAALGVPEVWRVDRQTVRFFVLTPGGGYEERDRSPTFPWLPRDEFVRFLHRFTADSELDVVLDFREWVRQTLLPLQPRVGGSGPVTGQP